MDSQSYEQNAPQDNGKAIIAWLQHNAIPLKHVEAGNGFSDLQPLKQLLKDVKVLGLGETTHGTREMFQLKHRLIDFLVMEMGFDTFTIEASFAACQPINDYVLHGIGDRAAVLTGQWYIPWDTEEVSAMLDWMRAYNQNAPDEKKVRFYGLDITRNATGRKFVLDYLRTVASDRVDTTETLFEAFAKEEAKWPLQMDEETKNALAHLLPQFQSVIDDFLAHKDSFVGHSSLREFDLAVQYVRVMQQFILTYAADVLPPSQSTTRSIAMAENLVWLADQARPDAKFMVWAHNAHVAVADTSIEEPNCGYRLREKYGQAYFAFGFEFNQGSFQTRTKPPDKLPGDIKEVTLPPSPEGSFSWYLSQTKTDLFMLNLRASADDPVVEQWLDLPQPMHFVAWHYNDTSQDYLELHSVRKYDGIIFIERTTASRPTVHALRTVSNRDGL